MADESAINIKVAAQDGNEVFFKIKRNTPLSKLMDAYCDRQGVDKQSVRFLYDGERVQDFSTPESLDMEDQDVISCGESLLSAWKKRAEMAEQRATQAELKAAQAGERARQALTQAFERARQAEQALAEAEKARKAEERARMAAEKVVAVAAAKEERAAAAASAKEDAAALKAAAREQATAERTERLSHKVLAVALHDLIIANQSGSGSDVILDGVLPVTNRGEVRFPRLLAERQLPSLLSKPSCGLNLERGAVLFVVARVLSGISVSLREMWHNYEGMTAGIFTPDELVSVLVASIELSAPEGFLLEVLEEALSAAANPDVVVPLLRALVAAEEAGSKPFSPSNSPAINAAVFFQKGVRMKKAALLSPWHAVVSWASNSAGFQMGSLSLEDRKEAVAMDAVVSVLGRNKTLPTEVGSEPFEDVSKSLRLLRGKEPDFWIRFPGTDNEPVPVHRFVCAATRDTHFAKLALAVQFAEGSTNIVDAELPPGVSLSAFERIVHSMYDPVAAASGLRDQDVGDAMSILHLAEYWMGLNLSSLPPLLAGTPPQRKRRRTSNWASAKQRRAAASKRAASGKAEEDDRPASGCFLTLATRAQEVVDLGVTAENCVGVWKAAEAFGDTDLVASALGVLRANVDGPAAAALLEEVARQPEEDSSSKKRSASPAKGRGAAKRARR